MVRVLMAMRGRVAQHTWQRSSRWPLVVALGLALASVAGTVALAVAGHRGTGASCDVLATVFALWFGGQLAQAALNGGDASLRPEVLALLPLPSRRLAWALMLIGLTDPVLVLLLLAYGALVAPAAAAGWWPSVTAAAAAVLLTVLTGVLGTVVSGLLGPGARRRRDAGTFVTALALSVLALAGPLLPGVVSALDHGRDPGVRNLVRALPSGWGTDAVRLAAGGDAWGAAGWLVALLALTAAVALAWPSVLRRRMTLGAATGRGSGRGRWASVLPASPTGGAVGRELREWSRDPLRLTCLLIAVVVGAGVALVPTVTAHTGLLMPFAGPLTVLIAGATACNLYGNDGSSFWPVVVTPGAARADVQGRAAAWALVVAPIGLAESVVLTAASDHRSWWPWTAALLLALFGGGVGLVPLLSLISVQPLDEAGNPTPGWSVKVHLALLALAAPALPAGALLVLGNGGGGTRWSWAALVVAALTGTVLAIVGLRGAVARLERRQVEVLGAAHAV